MELIDVALQFVLNDNTNSHVMDTTPLQIYSSLLFFSPMKNRLQTALQHEMVPWVSQPPKADEDWTEYLQTFHGHKDEIGCVAFSSDSALLASFSYDDTIRIWRVATGECIHVLESVQGSWAERWLETYMVFSHNSALLAMARQGNEPIWIWCTDTGQRVQTIEEDQGDVTALAFSHDDSALLASGSDAGTVHTWRAATGECVGKFEVHGGEVMSVVFSPDSALLGSVSTDNTLNIWRTSTGECMQTLNPELVMILPVGPLAFSHDSALVATSESDIVTISHVSTGKESVTLETIWPEFPQRIAFSHNSEFVKAIHGKNFYTWSVATGERLQVLPVNTHLDACAFSHDLELMAGGILSTLYICRATKHEHVQPLKRHAGPVSKVVFSPDVTILASASADGTIFTWNAATGDHCRSLQGHGDSDVLELAFSDDSALLASSSVDTIKIWHAATGECIKTMKFHHNSTGPISLIFSRDSERLAALHSGGIVSIWHVATGECIKTMDVHGSDRDDCLIGISPDFGLVASWAYKAIRILDTFTGECLQTLSCPCWTTSRPGPPLAVFSYDSGLVAITYTDEDGNRDATRICRVTTGECLRTFGNDFILDELSFRLGGTRSLTDQDLISLQVPQSFSDTRLDNAEADPYLGLMCDKYNEAHWISWNGANLMRLPSDCTRYLGRWQSDLKTVARVCTTFAFGSGIGYVIIIGFSRDELSKAFDTRRDSK